MNVMLQRHCARHIYVVPDGLKELMSDISREVLRSQPEDMYTFIADYLDALLITRENARVAAKFVQTLADAVETIVDLLNSSGLSMKEANHAAEIIQEAFRCWSNKKGILKEDDDAVVAKILADTGLTEAQAQGAAVCIQTAFKAFKNRQESQKQLLSGIIDWRVAARSAIQFYRKTGVSPEEAKRAANLIKAAYKGYYTRRALRKLNESNAALPDEMSEPESSSSEDTHSVTSDKKKAVRIDYNSVVPRVDFSEEKVLVGDEDYQEDTDTERLEKDEIIADQAGQLTTSSEEYIRALLEQYVIGQVGGEGIQEPQTLSQELTETSQVLERKKSDTQLDIVKQDDSPPMYQEGEITETSNEMSEREADTAEEELTTGAIAEALDQEPITETETTMEREGTTEEITELPTTDEE